MAVDCDIEDLLGQAEETSSRVSVPAAVHRKATHDGTRAQASGRLPGTSSVWLKTFGCSHNLSDAEYMHGQLQEYGYRLLSDEKRDEADLWLVNTCTVKNPSQSAMATLIAKGQESRKKLVVTGCVPQGDKNAAELQGLSLLGVSQIDRVVEAVEETLKGNTVQILAKKALPMLDLPKVRHNKHIEIVPLSTGCLGQCTYCKTKHARGQLGSYDLQALVARTKHTVADPDVRECWLSSEDTGAYGLDIGSSISELLQAMVAALPQDGSVMLRLGMTNPPFILQHLDAVAQALNHPSVFAFLHVPVQSGSDAVLGAMKREYTADEFCCVADTLRAAVPQLQLATDIICGFPGETEADHVQTLALVARYRFAVCHISQFYSRPGTPAARMKKVPTATVKRRSREASALIETFTDCYTHLVGRQERVWVVDYAADGHHLVAHNKGYVQVLLEPNEHLMGAVVDVKITSASRWSVKGTIVSWMFPLHMRPSAQQSVSAPLLSAPTAAVRAAQADGQPLELCDALSQQAATADRAEAMCCGMVKSRANGADLPGVQGSEHCVSDHASTLSAVQGRVHLPAAETASTAANGILPVMEQIVDGSQIGIELTGPVSSGKSTLQSDAGLAVRDACSIGIGQPCKRKHIDGIDCLLYAGVLLGLTGVLTNALWTLLFS